MFLKEGSKIGGYSYHVTCTLISESARVSIMHFCRTTTQVQLHNQPQLYMKSKPKYYIKALRAYKYQYEKLLRERSPITATAFQSTFSGNQSYIDRSRLSVHSNSARPSLDSSPFREQLINQLNFIVSNTVRLTLLNKAKTLVTFN